MDKGIVLNNEFLKKIKQWRLDLLENLANGISDEQNRLNQLANKVWNHGGGVPYPTRDKISIVNSESMSFNVKVGEKEVLFSIWLMTGEVRLGVKIPISLVSTEVIRQKISHSYDGSDCHRINKTGSDMFFDWIWADREFANFDFMTQAYSNDEHTQVILDRLIQILTHLYLAVTAGLLEGNRLSASHGLIGNLVYLSYLIDFVGDVSAIEYVVVTRLNGRIEMGDKIGQLSALIPHGSPLNAFRIGSEIHEPDGGVCMIVNFQRKE